MIVLLAMVFFTSMYGDASKEIQELHKQIGDGLIKIRKTSPDLQSDVYKILDQVGKLCRISNTEVQKHKRMEAASKEEREMRFALRVENEKLKHTLESLKEEYKNEHLRLVENKRKIDALTKEKTTLVQKNQEFQAKEREYKTKVKVLESSLGKPEDIERLSKNSKVPQKKLQA